MNNQNIVTAVNIKMPFLPMVVFIILWYPFANVSAELPSDELLIYHIEEFNYGEAQITKLIGLHQTAPNSYSIFYCYKKFLENGKLDKKESCQDNSNLKKLTNNEWILSHDINDGRPLFNW